MKYLNGIIDSTNRVAPIDPDTQLFFNRVTAAGGSLTATERTATNVLVINLKANNIWTRMGALYPFVGSSAAACAQNLKSSSYTGTFSGGWTYASNGVTPNGTNGYMNTSLTPSTYSTSADYGISLYINQINNGGSHIASDQGGTQQQYLNISTNGAAYLQLPGYSPLTASLFCGTNGQGLTILSLESPSGLNGKNFYYNGVSLISDGNFGNLTTIQSWLGCNTYAGGIQFSDARFALAAWHLGLNLTQATNFYNAVQTFQTALSRQV